MKLLLDTHALLWWLAGDASLPVSSRKAIASNRNEIHVSAASAWEIATKYRLGKLPSAAPIAVGIEAAIADQGFSPLPITLQHAQAAGSLEGDHRDPFDRMLIAQAMIEAMTLVSNERNFDSYGVKRLW